MKVCSLNTVLAFRIGENSEHEIKVSVEYVFKPAIADEPAEVEIKRIKFRYEDNNGRLYWIDLPDWMLEYIVADEPFQDELIENGAK